MESDNFIHKTFNVIDKQLRSASIATLDESMLRDKKGMSWFGGKFLGLSEEIWPETEHGPMLPLLQVQVLDLPYVPEPLKSIGLFTVFIDSRQPPAKSPLVNDHGWRIRTYANLEELKPLEQPEIARSLRPCPIRWELSSSEGPTWDDAQRLVDARHFFNVMHSILLYHERYKVHLGTKVGGWPGWIQKSLVDPEGFVMQIASEHKANWNFGDKGKCYLFFKRGEWLLYWDGF
jgi:hypothetical protein